MLTRSTSQHRASLSRPRITLLLVVAIVVPWQASTPAIAQQGQQSPTTSAVMTLNVKNMAVPEVLKLVADQGQLSLAIGAGVTGNLTLFVRDMPVTQLLRLAVEMAGATVALEDGVYRVMTRDAYESRYGLPYHDVNRQEFFQLNHVPVQDVITSLAPLRSPTGQILADPRSNSILAIESPSRLADIASVVGTLDRPTDTRAFELSQVSPQEIAQRLQNYLPASAQIEADPEGKRVLVSSSPPTLRRAERIIALLDRQQTLETRAFPLTYVAPDTMSLAVEGLLTPDVGRVVIDPRGRQLVVTDFANKIGQISDQVTLLDVPKRQALIEARIIIVQLKNELKVGIDWQVMEDVLNGVLTARASFPILAGSGENGLATEGTQVGYTDPSFTAVVDALEEIGTTELLSSPRVMVSDGQSAEILVGTQVPYITVDTREGASGNLDRFERVTIVDVGVKLRVKVRIHDDGMITMDISPEVSQVTGFSNDIPIVETSQASSVVTVQDGRTVILGGLKRDDFQETRKGVPLLSRIPLIKYLFSSVVKTKTRSELAVLLTPHIVTGRESFESMDDLLRLKGIEPPGDSGDGEVEPR